MRFYFESVLCFILFLIGFFCFVLPGSSLSYEEKLESFCNQLHDTNSCSIVYKNDDVVLFDTYNGYVTMENILK